jgi:hypothetical protein
MVAGRSEHGNRTRNSVRTEQSPCAARKLVPSRSKGGADRRTYVDSRFTLVAFTFGKAGIDQNEKWDGSR